MKATIYRTRNLDNFYLVLFQLVMANLAIQGHFEWSGNHYEKYNLNLPQLAFCYSFSNSPRTTVLINGLNLLTGIKLYINHRQSCL